jgi:putative ABC transport system substrate-binding protein
VRRRKVIGLLPGGAALAMAPTLPLRAQRTGRLPTIGWVVGDLTLAEISGPDPTNRPARAFLHRLRELGWIDGRTVRLERRSAEGQPARASAILAEFAALGVDVIFTGSTDWLIDIATKATRTIPVIAVFNRDPMATGLVASFARPGGTITGIMTSTGRQFYDKRLQLFHELVPGFRRLAFAGSRLAWDMYRAGSDGAALPPVFAPIDQLQDFEAAFGKVLEERADALFISHGPLLFTNARRIVAFAAANRLPASYPWREAIEAGGLMSYGAGGESLFRQVAGHVDRVLRGAKPAEMPIELPTKFELVVNQRTARALGLDLPASMLAHADDVIE